MIPINRIVVDMDDTIANFSVYVEEKTGMTPYELNQAGKMDEFLVDETLNGLFAKLTPVDDLELLTNFLDVAHYRGIDVHVCTVSMFEHHQTRLQKMIWLNQYFRNHYHVHFLDDFHKKADLFAREDTLLIDDNPKCVDPFLVAGGHAIYHTTVEDTMAEIYLNYQIGDLTNEYANS